MSLESLIYKKRRLAVANANSANSAKGAGVAGLNVSNVSAVSISAVSGGSAANDTVIVAAAFAGALAVPDGDVIHWRVTGPEASGSEAAMRAELASLSDRVADAMGWPDDERAWLAEYAARCPTGNLPADVRAYRTQVASLAAQVAAREAIDRARGLTRRE